MKTISTVPVILALFANVARAGPRSSASYSVPTDSIDAGGRRTTSASYTNDGSVGGITGISSVVAPAGTSKAGYIAQLYDITALAITAPGTSVIEADTIQLGARLVLDDASFLAVPATSVTWSVLSGPLTGISVGGLATAGIVYQDTVATVQGIQLGYTASLGLTVANTFPDNFGSYAGDGIDDDWQIQYFGLDNPLAAPGVDPDGDGQVNLFEFTAGLVPTDSTSLLRLRLDSVPGQPAHKNVVFFPLVAGRSYTVEFHLSLTSGTWQLLTGAPQSDNGNERTVTDTGATDAHKFYRVKVEKP